VVHVDLNGYRAHDQGTNWTQNFIVDVEQLSAIYCIKSEGD
jgi:hypothetical protein